MYKKRVLYFKQVILAILQLLKLQDLSKTSNTRLLGTVWNLISSNDCRCNLQLLRFEGISLYRLHLHQKTRGGGCNPKKRRLHPHQKNEGGGVATQKNEDCTHIKKTRGGCNPKNEDCTCIKKTRGGLQPKKTKTAPASK